jgi:hypothetical protein
MAITIPTTEPTTLRAGTSWTWRRDDLSADYPPAEWTLLYAFRSPAAHFDLTATGDATGYLIQTAPAVTAAKTAGEYTWYAFLQQSIADVVTSRVEIGSGTCTIAPDTTLAAAHDSRTVLQRILAAIDAVLLDRATNAELDLISAQSGDSGMTRDRAALMEWRDKIVVEIAREARSGGYGPSALRVRFR